MFKVTGIKPKAREDFENHRYIIEPLESDGRMRVGTALQAIKTTHVTWRNIAEFFGLSDQSAAFKLAYVQKPMDPSREALKEFMTIENGVAYMYDKDHKPENASVPHIPVKLVNKSVELKTYTNVPTKVTTRITLKDSIDRKLTMSITPTNGYIVGVTDLNMCNPGATYVVKGNAKTLNNLLHTIYFVGCNFGNAKVLVNVDDGAGKVNSISSAEVKLNVVASEQPSVPELTVPENINIVLGTDSPFEGLSVADKDNKIMELRVSPFGCQVFGFAGLLGVLEPGKVRTVYGRAATINKDIANLVVRTNRNDAQIGVELICGRTIIRKYIKFTVGGEIVPPGPEKANSIVDEAKVDESVLDE